MIKNSCVPPFTRAATAHANTPASKRVRAQNAKDSIQNINLIILSITPPIISQPRRPQNNLSQPRRLQKRISKNFHSAKRNIAMVGISFSRNGRWEREFSAKRNIAMVACRRMRLRRRDSGFRRNGRWETASIKRISIPAKAGISRGGIVRHAFASASRNFPLTREEIPAFAGMERGAGMEDGGRRQLK